MRIESRKAVLSSFDFLSIFLTTVFAYSHTLQSDFNTSPVEISRLVAVLLTSALFCLMYFAHKGHYGVKIPWWQQVRHVLRACFLLLFADILMNYIAFPEISGQRWIVLTWLLAIQNILITRWIARLALKWIGQWNIPVIIVGGARTASETLFALKSEGFLTYDIKQVILIKSGEDDIAEFREHHPDVQIALSLGDISKDDLLIMCPEDSDPILQKEILERVKSVGARYAISPPTSGLSLYGLKPQYYFGYRVVLLESNSKLQTFLGRLSKAALDRVGAALGLILLSPVFLILMMKVRKDGGPAFYAQRRIGQNGKEFRCWKFRSMIVNADDVLQDYLDKNPAAKEEYAKDFKLKDDPRITPVGHILRKSSLDEIPQLYNVLIGEMSLVGPRPIVQAEAHYYQDQFKYYLAVRPGITGLWQVSGRNDISYAQRVSLDAWYVENWSIWNDIVIILKTIYVVLVRKGAY